MNSKREITSSLNDIAGELRTRWTGESANAFYQQYITKLTEVVENFETDCSDLSIGAADLSEKLQRIEQNIDSK